MMLYPQATSEAGRKSVPIDSQPARTGRGGVPWIMYMLRNLRVLRGQLPPVPWPRVSGRRKHADGSRKRIAVPGRRRCPDGPPDAASLGAGASVRAGRKAKRRAGKGAVVWREARGLSRQRRQARPARRVLSAPQGLARLRPQRGMRPALPLPRLEIRYRRNRRRHAVGAESKRAAREGQTSLLSDARGRWIRLDLYGTARDNAGIRGAALGTARRSEGCDCQGRVALQLGADQDRKSTRLN